LRARPEPTQLEDLSYASFLGKLLVLPANVRLDWKVIARYKYSSLFGLVISNKEKSFITLIPGVNVTKLFFQSSPILPPNRLDHLYSACLFYVRSTYFFVSQGILTEGEGSVRLTS
jgi:hypothetical protein